MGGAVLVPIGPGPNGPPTLVDDGRAGNDVVAEAAGGGASHLAALALGLDEVIRPEDAGAEARTLVADLGSALDEQVGLSLRGRWAVLSIRALVDVGGFDPDEPGLGLLDLVDRLARCGWSIRGVDRSRLPFVPALTAGLDPIDRVASEGRWLIRQATDRPGRRQLERYRRLVAANLAELRDRIAEGAASPEADALLDRMTVEFERDWRGHRPDESQRGVGRRADWRHLLPALPPGRRRRRAVLVGLGSVNDWRWLVEDGWVDRVDDTIATGPSSGPPADVIVLGPAPAAVLTDQLDPAVSALAEGGTLCLLVTGGRTRTGIGGHRRLIQRLGQLGLTSARRHLAMPDAAGAKRYIPLDHPAGLAWLAGPEPALAAAALPPTRRRFREVARRVGAATPELLGDVVIVATAATPSGDWPEAVVVTSGFDEGSRTVLLAFDGPDAVRPASVVKVPARPAYRANGDREHRLLQVIAPRVDPPGLVPTPADPVECDGLPAVVESYAGRWTATDILNEQTDLSDRAELLEHLLDAVTALNRTGSGTEIWSDDAFEALVGRWFAEIDEFDGRSATRAALLADLADRSHELNGISIPVGLRHFDLGPWNLVLADDGVPTAVTSPVTAVDWELAPPREIAFGPIGADQLYLTKYWLHIAQDCRSVAEEQSAFAFLAHSPAGPVGGDGPQARRLARAALMRSADQIGIPPAFLALLEAGVWAEASCYTARRRRSHGGDGGSPARYLHTLARHRATLLRSWS